VETADVLLSNVTDPTPVAVQPSEGTACRRG
jgi:hypothetical protein